MTALTYRNGISIFEVIYYAPALLIAISLGFKHGFGRSAGWYFLVIFSLARLIGASMQLATINAPTNISLYIGAAILQNIGISPLLLASYGLLSRVITHINTTKMTLITPRYLKAAELLIIVGLILGIVGGSDSGTSFSKTGQYVPQSTSKASVVIFVIAFLFLAIATAATFASISAVIAGERRLLIVIAVSLPFLLVRVLYSTISAFTGPNSDFNSFNGSPTILLVMGLIMEAIVVFLDEAVGLALERNTIPPPRIGQHENADMELNSSGDSTQFAPRNHSHSGEKKQDNVALKIAKKTIIGRMVMAIVGDSKESNRGDSRY